MKGKKVLSLLLAMTMVLTTVLVPMSDTAHAASPKVEEPVIYDPDTSYTRDDESGHISIPQDYDVPEPEVPESYGIAPNGASSSDSAYHPYGTVSSMYPGTRNQNPYGTCWAFATAACAEFDMITDGVLKNDGYANFSELQLVYNMYHTGNDRLGNLDGDEISMANDATKTFLDVGGNMYYTQHVLANWKAFAHEDTIPYSRASTSMSLANWEVYHNNMARLENCRQLNIKTNPTAVKQAIIDNGAAYISYYHNSNYYDLNSYNGSTYALYYNPSNTTTNHDVAIVGWNNSFPRYAWPSDNRPPADGAWLVRNSWTTKTGGSEYSYFWMSYHDVSLANAAYSLEFGQGDNGYTSDNNYDHIYQHDGVPTHSRLSANKVASVFKAANKDGYKSETLDAVMISSSFDTNASYKIEIYTGLTSSSNPESGYLHSNATTYASTTYSGIYTFKLKNPVYLAPGEKYAIVVTETSGSGYFDIERDTTISGWFKTNASADAGESFYKNSSSSSWTDVTTASSLVNYGNISVKGLTNNSSVGKYTITYNMNGGTNSSSNPAWYLSNSGTITLKTPTRNGYHFLGWYTDSSYTTKVTSISGSMGKNLTLYAKWGAHTYKEVITKKATMTKDGTIDNVCTTCNYAYTAYYILHPTSVELAYKKTTYSGEAKQPSVTVSTEKGVINVSSITYSNNVNVGQAKVTITLPEKYYTGSWTENFVITPKAPSTSSAKLYGYDDVKFSWSKSSGATGYYVYYKKASSSSYTYWGYTTNRYAKIKNLSDGVKYNFKVVPSVTIDGTKYKGLKSKVSSTYTLKKVSQPTVTDYSANQVRVKWKNISGESGYQISRSTSSTGTNIVATYETTSGVSKRVKATAGKTYYYKVRAYKKVTIDGETKKIYGPWSKVRKHVL